MTSGIRVPLFCWLFFSFLCSQDGSNYFLFYFISKGGGGGEGVLKSFMIHVCDASWSSRGWGLTLINLFSLLLQVFCYQISHSIMIPELNQCTASMFGSE